MSENEKNTAYAEENTDSAPIPSENSEPKTPSQTASLSKRKKSDGSKTQKVAQAMEHFTQNTVVKEPPKKKHGWISMVVLLLIIGLGIFLMVQLASSVGQTELRSLGDILANLDVKYTLIFFAVLLGVMILETLKFIITTKATTGKCKIKNSMKVAFLGKYYDNITPFGSGGQPMQIMYLHKKGYSAGVSSAIVMIKYFFQMVCWVTLCFIFMVFNSGALQNVDAGQREVFLVTGWIGWAINALLPVSIILFAILPKMTNKVLAFFINIVTKASLSIAKRKEHRTGKSQMQRKIKILRKKEKWINSAHTAVNDFRSSFIVMSHKPFHFIMLMVCCIAEHLFTWSLPYFILIAFANGEVPPSMDTMLAIMTLNVFALMSCTIVPTPGNSGVLENVVILLFKALATSVVFWVVFTWRFLTYYIYIIIGIGITVFEVIRKVVRSKRQQKLQTQQPSENGGEQNS